MTRRTTHHLLALLAITVVTLLAVAAPAVAAASVPIQIGSTGQTIGSATFTRTQQSDGTESIAMSLDVTGSGTTLDEVHVCVGTTPFTDRIPPGQCRFGFTGLSGTTFTRTLDLGRDHVGRPVCLQAHLAVHRADGVTTDTGYAGWIAGKPFFGSLCLEPGGTSVPVGAVGLLGLSGLLAAGIGTVALVRRRVR